MIISKKRFTINRAAGTIACPAHSQLLPQLNFVFLLARFPAIGSFNAYAPLCLIAWSASKRGAGLGAFAPNIGECVTDTINRTIHDITGLPHKACSLALRTSILWHGAFPALDGNN